MTAPRVLVTTWPVPGADDTFRPTPATDDAAGADVRVRLQGDLPPALRPYLGRAGDTLTVPPHTLVRLPLGFRAALPPTHYALLMARSSLAKEHGLAVPHGAGVIDPDYTGEWLLQVQTGAAPATLRHGDRVGQVLLLPRIIGQFVRGAGDDRRATRDGFGSTGRR